VRLELGNINIKDVQFGDITKVENGILYINKEEIISIVMEDDHIKSVKVELAKPGEETRITPVKDVIEPRVKVEGVGGIFPGLINKVTTVGSGRTHVLKGASVITCGKIVGFQEGIIDMNGPGAEYTPFSKLNNICLVIEPINGLEQRGYEKAVRMAGLKVATFIGKTGKKVIPDEIEVYETKPLLESVKEYPELPRVAYVYMLQTQGLLHDTYVYGVDAKKIVPTILYPTEVMDGAILSGNCVSACDKNTTYHHLNNPIIHDLYERHGKDINFVGVIITNENVYLADKERSSNWTAKLCKYLGLDGAIISQEGFGNPDTDLIMKDADESADAVVTGGNANEVILLPPMKKIIGMLDYVDRIAGGFDGSLKADGSIEAEMQVIIGATNELGFNRMSATEY